MKFLQLIIGLGLLSLFSCSKQDNEIPDTKNESQQGNWLVPFEDILYWGDPSDEILSIEDPKFIKVSESDWNDEDRMFVHFYDDFVRVYPVNILEEHEIVNDNIGDLYFALSYCPITGSGMTWNRTINNEVTEFGVSGMLYQENLVPYDRNTGSVWSQMLMLCIHGELIETVPEPTLMFETDFELIFGLFPNAEILVDPIPAPSNNVHQALIYKSTEDEIDPGNGTGEVLSPGTYYYGVIDKDRVVVFDIDIFDDGIQVIKVGLRGKSLIVAGSSQDNFVVSFELKGNVGSGMMALQDQLPLIMQDATGNTYDLFGKAVAGPQKGLSLKPGRGYRAKGFAWESIFNTVEIFSGN